jgi:light-regulated signal transduction histidine kinase (bacteriophytochrome)
MVLDSLQASVAAEHATVTFDPLPTVLGDATQLGQLLQNLVANAIKYRGKQPPRIHVSAAERPHEWLFSVRDNGIGIAPEYFERIFIIFQRLHTIEEYGGTGIGLAICKKIVERHGGRIWVESKPGEGTTFFFTIPKREKAA